MKRKTLLLVTFIITAITGCAAIIAVDSDFDSNTDFSRYTSFVVESVDPEPTGDARLDDNPFFDSRVRSALQEELTGLGLESASENNADLIVHYHMFVVHRERLDVDQIDRELDTGRGYIFHPEIDVDVVPYDEGTFMIDIADRGNKQVIWRGWARVVVTDVLDDRDALDQRMRETINKIVSKYPRG